MEYRAIGLMSGSSLDGLDIVAVSFLEQGGQWQFTLGASECIPYSATWVERLRGATELAARDYCLLHTDYGRWLGEQVNAFIDRHQLHYKTSYYHQKYNIKQLYKVGLRSVSFCQ